MGTKFLTIMLAILVVMSMAVYAGDEAKYVGSKKCKTCHNADKNCGLLQPVMYFLVFAECHFH